MTTIILLEKQSFLKDVGVTTGNMSPCVCVHCKIMLGIK